MNPIVNNIIFNYDKKIEALFDKQIRASKISNENRYSYFSNIDDIREPPKFNRDVKKVGDQRLVMNVIDLHEISLK